MVNIHNGEHIFSRDEYMSLSAPLWLDMNIFTSLQQVLIL